MNTVRDFLQSLHDIPWLDLVLRDISWAAVEQALEQPDFFNSVIMVDREGRWPCAWEGKYPKGRFVVL